MEDYAPQSHQFKQKWNLLVMHIPTLTQLYCYLNSLLSFNISDKGSENNSGEDSEDEEGYFGQEQVPLTDEIREILEEYPDGQIFKVR